MTSRPILGPLPPREGALGAAARTLRDAILSGRFQPGSWLPPERELAAELGISRLTLRSALAQLEASRLVRVRQGSGYVVRDFRREGGLDLLPALLTAAASPDQRRDLVADLLSVRRLLARGVLLRLLEVKPAALDGIEQAIETFAATVERGSDAEAIAVADHDVVHALVEHGGSTVLLLCINPVFRVLASMPAVRDAMYAEPALNVAAYRALMLALRARKPRMVEAMVEKLESLDALLLARLERASGRRKR